MTKYKIVNKPVLIESPFSGVEQYVIHTISDKNRIFNFHRVIEQEAIDLYNEKLKQLA